MQAKMFEDLLILEKDKLNPPGNLCHNIHSNVHQQNRQINYADYGLLWTTIKQWIATQK